MKSRKLRKYGHFFTSKETALYMASLFPIPEDKEVLIVLDAEAGTRILLCAIMERLQDNGNIKKVELIYYETDENILGV